MRAPWHWPSIHSSHTNSSRIVVNGHLSYSVSSVLKLVFSKHVVATIVLGDVIGIR